jgi:adenylosuccinate synthase
MPGAAILGAQWGDEGKGKLVDMMSADADLVLRFQGGPNAGHTIVVGDPGHEKKLVLHHIPSGLLHERPVAIMGEGMVIDPITLLKEIAQLRESGAEVTPRRLVVSLDASVILPVHRALDAARETARGAGAIGTTLRGIGPTYEDRASRRGLRFRDLLDLDEAERKLGPLLTERNQLLAMYGAEAHELGATLATLREWRDALGDFFAETAEPVTDALDADKRVLFEGAQGAMLDIAFGTYPYVTSSHTVSGGICVGAGVPPARIHRVLGVTKAYTTRVGAGPFPTELGDDAGRHLARVGHEFGATTGRPRRCGWLDLTALAFAHARCGFSSWAITKLDVLSGLPEVAVCVGYELDGQRTDRFPRDPAALARVQPVYERFEGWTDDISACSSRDELPSPALRLVERIEALTGIPAAIVSVGAHRRNAISQGDPLWS